MKELTRINFIDTDGRSNGIFGYTKKTLLEKIDNNPFESDIYAVVVKTKEDGDYILDSTIDYTIKKKENDRIGWSGRLVIDLYKNDSYFKNIYNGNINNISSAGFSENIIDHDSLTANSYKLCFKSDSMYSENEPPVYYKITSYYNQDEVLDAGTIYEGYDWIYINNNNYHYGTLLITISSDLL